ncbi:MAG: TIGR01841 family phasin [Pseudomonadota bacterium]
MTENTETALQKAMSAPMRLTRGSVVRVRGALNRTAGLVASAKGPTQRIGSAGLKINEVAHDGIDQLVRHQVQVVEGIVDESAQRLQLAAQAGSLSTLVNEQVSMLPQTRTRVVNDVRTTIGILGNTQAKMTAAVREEFSNKSTLQSVADEVTEAASEAASQVAEAAEAAVAEVTAKA